MAKIVSLINMKGGVGKSTLAVNLAWHFALTRGSMRVLVVDLDPQFNASLYLLGASEYRRVLQTGQPTTWDVLEKRTRHPQASGVAFQIRDAIHNRITTPAGTSRIDAILSRLELAFSLKTPYQQKEQELASALVSVKDDYDLVLIDCAPTESLLTTAAYLASDFLLIPVKPEFLSTIGLPLLVQSLAEFASSYPQHPLQLAGVAFNATTDYAPEEALAKGDVQLIAEQNNWHVFAAEVPYSRSFPKSARHGLSIYSTPNTRSRLRRRFAAFAEEFAQRIGL